MALPIPPNPTCDIYRVGVVPPAPPAKPDVPCFLKCDWLGGQDAGDRNVNALTWTHVMLVDSAFDLRDGYLGQCGSSVQDSVYIPDQHGTVVIFTELLQRGTPYEHKRVYLDRQLPGWPSNDL